MAKKTRFKPPYTVDIWDERDRVSIVVTDADGRDVAEWWDDDVRDMIESGFFDQRDLAASVIEYLVEVGVIPEDPGWKAYGRLPEYDET